MPHSRPLNLTLTDVRATKRGTFQFGKFIGGYFCSRSKDKDKKANEDSIIILEKKNTLLLGVADGAGGHPRGNDASIAIVKCINRYFALPPLELVELCNQHVLDLNAGARSTLAIAQITDSHLRCYSVGDSEIVHWNSRGSKLYSTIPHSTVGHKIRAGIISQPDSLEDPDRFEVNHLLGDEFIRIEATTGIPIKRGHMILVGTDGLFDNVSHTDLQQQLFSAEFEEAFCQLCETCVNQIDWHKLDDTSFVVLKKIKA